MRMGVVRGHVVLNLCLPALQGTRLLVVEPITGENLGSDSGAGGGRSLIVADRLGPAVGQRVAFVEGREAANPYWPESVPVDAYCSMILDQVDYRPPNSDAREGRAGAPGVPGPVERQAGRAAEPRGVPRQ